MRRRTGPNHAGDVVAAISIAGPSIRVTRERIAELASHVVRAADEISAELGYRIASNGASKTAVRRISSQPARLSGGLR